MALSEGHNPLKTPFNASRRRFIWGVGTAGLTLATGIALFPRPTNSAETTVDPLKETLLSGGMKGIAHNAANIDQFPEDRQRYSRFLRSNAWGVELDIQFIDGKLVIGHIADDITRMLRDDKTQTLWATQSFDHTMKLAVTHNKHIKCDFRESMDSDDAVDAFAEKVNAVEESTLVILSGTNWKRVHQAQEKIERRVITDFTLDGHNGRTPDKLVLFRSQNPTKNGNINGMAIPYNQILNNQGVISALHTSGHFVDVYGIPSTEGAQYAYSQGARGITTDYEEVLNDIAA